MTICNSDTQKFILPGISVYFRPETYNAPINFSCNKMLYLHQFNFESIANEPILTLLLNVEEEIILVSSVLFVLSELIPISLATFKNLRLSIWL